jgi:predicted aconitase with swiveling domain
MASKLTGRVVIPGAAEGITIVSKEPLSFWGGVNPDTGEVIDRRHDCSGRMLAGSIFVFPNGKGSSTGSAVLMECVKNHVAPNGIINTKLDPILALGAVIVEVLYQKTIPMIILAEEDFDKIKENDHVTIEADGSVIIHAS